MVRVKGQLHSELASGSASGVTHKHYRGNGIATKRRNPPGIRIRLSRLDSPLNVDDCFSWICAGRGQDLRSAPPLYYCKSLNDLAGGFSYVAQLDNAKQPLWTPSDPLHGGYPFITPDGLNDYLMSPSLTIPLTAPYDIWFVAMDPGTPTSARVLSSFHQSSDNHLNCAAAVANQWVWYTPVTPKLALWSNSTLKIFRLVITGLTIQLFWNGVAQTIPKAYAGCAINILRMFCSRSYTAFYNKPLFDFAMWLRILNPVEVNSLLRYWNFKYKVF